jgi:hypothetical protein
MTVTGFDDQHRPSVQLVGGPLDGEHREIRDTPIPFLPDRIGWAVDDDPKKLAWYKINHDLMIGEFMATLNLPKGLEVIIDDEGVFE